MMKTLLGTEALLAIIVNLLFIIVTWWALTSIKWESIMKKGHVAQIRLFMVLLTITISSTVSSFFLDYLQYAKNITYLLK